MDSAERAIAAVRAAAALTENRWRSVSGAVKGAKAADARGPTKDKGESEELIDAEDAVTAAARRALAVAERNRKQQRIGEVDVPAASRPSTADGAPSVPAEGADAAVVGQSEPPKWTAPQNLMNTTGVTLEEANEKMASAQQERRDEVEELEEAREAVEEAKRCLARPKKWTKKPNRTSTTSPRRPCLPSWRRSGTETGSTVASTRTVRRTATSMSPATETTRRPRRTSTCATSGLGLLIPSSRDLKSCRAEASVQSLVLKAKAAEARRTCFTALPRPPLTPTVRQR